MPPHDKSFRGQERGERLFWLVGRPCLPQNFPLGREVQYGASYFPSCTGMLVIFWRDTASHYLNR
jgi:hypothetical protein